MVVELFDDARLDADMIAKEILDNLEDVRLTYAAYDDGFGRLVRSGPERSVAQITAADRNRELMRELRDRE